MVVGLQLVLSGIAHGETLRIATWNVMNYVAVDRVTSEGWRPEYPKPEEEKTAIRRVLRHIDADILILEEMVPLPYLQELQRDLASEGLHYPLALLVNGPDADRHVALLSRRLLVGYRLHEHLPIGYLGRGDSVSRELLEVSVSTEAGEITLFGLHLKSRLTVSDDDPEAREQRVAEALAVRAVISRRFPFPGSGRFLALGDVNDTRDSRALRLLATRGSTVLMAPVPAHDSRGETWTHFHGSSDTYSRVDYILASPRLQSAVRSGVAQVVDTPDVLVASDHRPLVVTLDLELEALPAVREP